MRPSDENQHRSKRPNLFSGANRPGSDDEHILARLERDAATVPAYQPQGRARMLLLSAAVLSIVTLLAVLGLLINGNSNAPAPPLMDVAVRPAPAAPVQVPAVAEAPAAVTVDQADHLADLPPSLVTVPPHAAQAAMPVLRSIPVRQAFKRPAPAIKARPSPPTAEPALDSDVAILTAILAQSPRHTPATVRP